ncbi:hypothetical protein [Polymorphobacter megasporae]|uniref:hypothetical protein n=1 Tax=Glacieibacterium megasporae TaxID=2835787 RepID=UPI001C1E1D49|nr:hypothetical protein [Polymorphobacter megasporae]UAJ12775.1 hypothetical protein KTC28_19730 [Polymorphobacter megasporae]
MIERERLDMRRYEQDRSTRMYDNVADAGTARGHHRFTAGRAQDAIGGPGARDSVLAE